MAFGAFQSYRLDQILEMGLLSLYENWDDLPRKSTKRYLRNLCEQLADQLSADATDSVYEDQILDFWKQAERLPRVREFAKASLGHLDRWVESKTMSGSVRPGVRSFSLTQVPESDFSKERLHLLATLLRDEDPLFYVDLPYNVYQLPETFEAVQKALQRSISFGLLPADLTPEVQQLLQKCTADEQSATTYRERCKIYLETIHALNQIGQIQSMIQGTLEPYRTVKTHRGFEPKGDINEAGQSGDDGTEESVEVNFFTDVDFPSSVKKHEVTPLVVQLKLDKPEGSQVEAEVSVPFADLAKPELVDVVVITSGFSEVTGIWSRKIEVYSTQNSQPAVFLLKGKEEGTQRITIDFSHNGRHLSSGSFEVDVYTGMSQSTPMPERTFPPVPDFPQNPPPPPDLELRIARGKEENKLSFMLHSTNAKVGYHWKKMGEVELTTDKPHVFLEHKFRQLSEFAATPTEHSIDTMQDMGLQLFEELLPKELQNEYWKRIQRLKNDGIIQSFMITSDEPWIPWELIKPYKYDEETDEEVSGGFWAEDFQLSRWLAGKGPNDELEIKAAQVVVPELDPMLHLDYVLEEKLYFDKLQVSGINVGQPLQSKGDVIQQTCNGGIELLHFSTHGSFNSENPEHSSIILKDGVLTPDDLNSRKTKGLQRSKPLIFLNACHTGKIGISLTGLGGWAKKFVDTAGASAFIGSLWEVNDLLAAEFAIKFYDELQAGKTLGEAFLSARLTIRERQPGNSTWLAYTLYGDPNSKVTWRTND